MKRKTIFILICITLVSLFVSCKKFTDVAPPADALIGDEAFADDATATATTTGLYTRMMGNNGAGQMTTGGTSIFLGLCADELNFSSTSPSLIQQYQEFFNNSISPSSPNLWPRFWQNPYNYLYHANACIEGLGRAKKLTDSLRQRLTGEMKFMRAFVYFYLVNEFGDVPLVTGTDYRENAIKASSSAAKVYEQIVQDLREAEALLTESYASAGKARPNKWAAAALLARVYLYQKDWSHAVAAASEVIASGKYSMVTPLSNVFVYNSNEAILQFLTSTSSVVNSYDGNLFIPSSTTSVPTFTISSSLFNSFEAGDQRKSSWLKSNTVNGQPYYYPFKYKVRTNTTPVAEATVAIRLAEMYLIRAEANAHLNNISEAQKDLNIIRNRAGLPNTTAASEPDLLVAIEKERLVEFFSEWGHRWMDLKRTNRANEILSVVKGNYWQSTDVLFPFPDYELQHNPYLTQNPGY